MSVKKVKLFFPEDKRYRAGKKEKLYEGGKVHEIVEDPKKNPGYIQRWIKRGCILAEEHEASKKAQKPAAPKAPQKPVDDKSKEAQK